LFWFSKTEETWLKEWRFEDIMKTKPNRSSTGAHWKTGASEVFPAVGEALTG
jgi:hypothetical protein